MLRPLHRLSALCLLVFLGLFAAPGVAQEFSVAAGEIGFQGTVTSFDEAKRELIISVSSFTLPNGKSSTLTPPKPKTILLIEQTKLLVQNQPDEPVEQFLKPGAAVSVVGKDQGTGKDVPARLVLVVPLVKANNAEGDDEAGAPAMRVGETRYEGKITGVLSPTVFTVRINTATNAGGETEELFQAQDKNVQMDTATIIRSRADAERRLKFEDMKVGQRVTFIATGTGKTLKSREVALWDDDGGKIRTLNTVTISSQVGQLVSKGDEARDARLYEDAIKIYNQALTLGQGINDSPGQALVLGRLGMMYRQIDQPKRALESYQSALSIWRRIGNHSSAATALLNISRYHLAHDDLKQARSTVDEVLQLLQGSGNGLGMIYAYDQLGSVQAASEDTEGALSSWQQGLGLARQLKDREWERSLLGDIALTHAKRKDADKAQAVIEELIFLILPINDKATQADSYWSIGGAFVYLDRKAEALATLKRAETLFTEAGQRGHAGRVQKQIEKLEAE